MPVVSDRAAALRLTDGSDVAIVLDLPPVAGARHGVRSASWAGTPSLTRR
ncbi:hypothetical protein QTQ03_10250 [Micromonospora sp. WMMA1363]|nr:hypothetical protein [Micromonospora sp. WMMA1363]MDM4719941.1 hypothetical protein [Micromonospora sp. WMMA1363]